MIRFDEVRTKRRGDVAFAPSALPKFPAVRRVADPFGRGKVPDEDVFYETLRRSVAAAHPGSERVAGFFDASAPRPCLRLFVYLASREIVPLEIETSATLRSWLAAFTDELGSKTRGIQFRVEANSSSMSSLSEETSSLLATNPLKLALSEAPPSFTAADERARKATHLAKLAAKAGRAGKTNGAALDRTFRAFLDARKHKKAPPVGMDARLEALEKRMGLSLPAALKVLYRRADGGKKLFFDHDMLSLRALEEQWRMWTEIYDEWTLAELTDNSVGQPGVTQGLYACPRWIPFVDLVGGHYLAFDLLPGPKGAAGQIILFGRDVSRVRRVTPDAKTFLEECLAFDGKTGKLAAIFTELEL
jgi:cell wall assembly regulator SMI1